MAGMRDMWRAAASPRGAIADLKTVIEQAGPNRWRIALLSALATYGLFSVMTSQSWTKQRELPEVTYINSWPADRTAAETKAFIAENQRRKEERAALEARIEAETKAFWKALGRASGMDVEAIEAEAEAERKAAEAEAERNAVKASKGQPAVAR